MGERILITGTSSGIGLSAAVECAALGHEVVATMRDPKKSGELEAAARARGVTVKVEALDVVSPDVAARVAAIEGKHGSLYALVNNAGIGVGGAFEEQSDRDVRDQFETNVFGAMAVTRAVLPSMRAARRGRVVNVSSLSGLIGWPLVAAYAATKHAVEGWSEALRWELDGFGVQVCLVEPGAFKTPIFFGNQRRGAGVGSVTAYAELSSKVERMLVEQAEKAPPPDAVGKAIARIVSARSPAFRTRVGTDVHAVVALRRLTPDRLYAAALRTFLKLPRAD